MPQSLIQLPKTANFRILGWSIIIEDHTITNNYGLLGKITRIIVELPVDRQALYQFEKHGISWEAAIEYCTRELEDNPRILATVIRYYGIDKGVRSDTMDDWNNRVSFSESAAGRKIAEQFVEKIRSCGNWGELYDELQLTTKFSKYMKERIIKEIKK